MSKWSQMRRHCTWHGDPYALSCPVVTLGHVDWYGAPTAPDASWSADVSPTTWRVSARKNGVEVASGSVAGAARSISPVPWSYSGSGIYEVFVEPIGRGSDCGATMLGTHTY